MANPLQDLGALVSAVAQAYAARFADIGQDIVAVEALEQLLADVGVPDAALALALTETLHLFVRARQAFGPDPGQYWFYKPGPQIGGR